MFARAEADDIGRKRFGFGEFGPVLLAQQLECELELVVQRKTMHGVRDGRFVHNHPLHVPQPLPAFAWW